MPAIFLQEPLPSQEIASLHREFPHYDLLTSCGPEGWESVEVLYGGRLSEEELKRATRLQWIHSPTADTEGLCLSAVKRVGGIYVSLSKGQNVPQIAEFVIGGILTFAKQFLHWPQASHDPQEFWDWPLKETMWTLQKKILLQVGLGEVGSAIVKQANSLGMKSWGVRRERSFHPHCHKTFPLKNLHSLLPAADIVVIALPQGVGQETVFGRDEFELMKRDSILVIVGSSHRVDMKGLVEVGKTGKFRGILIDAFRPQRNSPLWEIPNIVLTPAVASYPESEEHLAFRTFRRNLRVFIPGKVNEMRNLIEI